MSDRAREREEWASMLNICSCLGKWLTSCITMKAVWLEIEAKQGDLVEATCHKKSTLWDRPLLALPLVFVGGGLQAN